MIGSNETVVVASEASPEQKWNCKITNYSLGKIGNKSLNIAFKNYRIFECHI